MLFVLICNNLHIRRNICSTPEFYLSEIIRTTFFVRKRQTVSSVANSWRGVRELNIDRATASVIYIWHQTLVVFWNSENGPFVESTFLTVWQDLTLFFFFFSSCHLLWISVHKRQDCRQNQHCSAVHVNRCWHWQTFSSNAEQKGRSFGDLPQTTWDNWPLLVVPFWGFFQVCEVCSITFYFVANKDKKESKTSKMADVCGCIWSQNHFVRIWKYRMAYLLTSIFRHCKNFRIFL